MPLFTLRKCNSSIEDDNYTQCKPFWSMIAREQSMFSCFTWTLTRPKVHRDDVFSESYNLTPIHLINLIWHIRSFLYELFTKVATGRLHYAAGPPSLMFGSCLGGRISASCLIITPRCCTSLLIEVGQNIVLMRRSQCICRGGFCFGKKLVKYRQDKQGEYKLAARPEHIRGESPRHSAGRLPHRSRLLPLISPHGGGLFKLEGTGQKEKRHCGC